MKKKDDVVLSGLTASATNELFEVGFGGLITLTAAFVFLGLSGTIAAVQGGHLRPRLHHPAGGLRPHGPLRQLRRRDLVLHAVPGRHHQLDLDVPALPRLLPGGARLAAARQATTLMVSICVVGSFLVMYYSKDGIFWSDHRRLGRHLPDLHPGHGADHLLLAGSSGSSAAGRRPTRARSIRIPAVYKIRHEVRGADSTCSWSSPPSAWQNLPGLDQGGGRRAAPAGRARC